jgi:hypothetical protein
MDSFGIHCFTFESFAGEVHKPVSRHLLCSAGEAAK